MTGGEHSRFKLVRRLRSASQWCSAVCVAFVAVCVNSSSTSTPILKRYRRVGNRKTNGADQPIDSLRRFAFSNLAACVSPLLESPHGRKTFSNWVCVCVFAVRNWTCFDKTAIVGCIMYAVGSSRCKTRFEPAIFLFAAKSTEPKLWFPIAGPRTFNYCYRH